MLIEVLIDGPDAILFSEDATREEMDKAFQRAPIRELVTKCRWDIVWTPIGCYESHIAEHHGVMCFHWFEMDPPRIFRTLDGMWLGIYYRTMRMLDVYPTSHPRALECYISETAVHRCQIARSADHGMFFADAA